MLVKVPTLVHPSRSSTTYLRRKNHRSTAAWGLGAREHADPHHHPVGVDENGLG